MAVSARRRSPVPKRLIGALLIGLLAWSSYTVGTNGELRLPFTDIRLPLGQQTAEAGPPFGTVAVPRTTRPLSALQMLSRDDLSLLTVDHLPADVVEANGLITDVAELHGRVLKTNKEAGFAFHERDFMPKGTRPGVVAGIPPDKRAMRIEADKVPGLVGLNQGDSFDILFSIPVGDGKSAISGPIAGPYAAQLELAAAYSGAYEQAIVRVVVQNGVIVSPVQTRNVPIYTSSLTQGAVTRTRPVQEVVVAVAPDEVAPLTQAVAVGAGLTCIPRSGHPDDTEESMTPGSEPTMPISLWGSGSEDDQGQGSLVLIESIVGTERQFRPVPRAGGD